MKGQYNNLSSTFSNPSENDTDTFCLHLKCRPRDNCLIWNIIAIASAKPSYLTFNKFWGKNSRGGRYGTVCCDWAERCEEVFELRAGATNLFWNQGPGHKVIVMLLFRKSACQSVHWQHTEPQMSCDGRPINVFMWMAIALNEQVASCFVASGTNVHVNDWTSAWCVNSFKWSVIR